MSVFFAGGGRGGDDLPDPLDRHRAREEAEGGQGREGQGEQPAGAGERERVSGLINEMEMIVAGE